MLFRRSLRSSCLILAAGLLTASSAFAKDTEDKKFAIDTSGTTTSVKNGSPGVLKLNIRPAAGYKVSLEAPIKIALTSDQLKLSKQALGNGDAEDKKSTAALFSVPFEAKSTGDGAIAADASFFICSDTICERKTEKVTVAVQVKP